VYIIDRLNPASKYLVREFSSGDSWSIDDWSPDGTKLLLSEYLSANESNLWSLSLVECRLTLLTPKKQGEQIAYSQGRYSPYG
ncbi:hypothetical protein, partial [Pantoea ananatis]|uniref:hypothetical protein n=1 Tax=Pantoea ananas TaxID=553 RepID=UPI002B1D16E0